MKLLFHILLQPEPHGHVILQFFSYGGNKKRAPQFKNPAKRMSATTTMQQAPPQQAGEQSGQQGVSGTEKVFNQVFDYVSVSGRGDGVVTNRD